MKKRQFLLTKHSKQILGGIWVIRKINSLMKHGKYQGDFTIYGLQDGLCFLEKSCQFHEACLHYAKDAGMTAQKLGVQNLILYHTENSDLQNRKKTYSTKAAKHFNRAVYVPDDLETIFLD